MYDPASFRRVYVETSTGLDAVVRDIAGASVVGVDAEMGQRVRRKPGGLQEWVHILALIQVAGNGVSAVIDPLRVADLAPLKPLLGGSSRKVFLGGGQDVALLEKEGLPVRNVVDVGEVALGIFGRREDGMAALAHRIFGISLDKTVRRADWMARPLNSALVTYAHRDAELTLLIYEWFRETYPAALAAHERVELEPDFPAMVPTWIREGTQRSADPLAVLMAHGLDPHRDAEKLVDELSAALDAAGSPRQVNRILRLAGDVRATALLPRLDEYLASTSSFVRAAAARCVGLLAQPEEGGPLLDRLHEDPVADVRKAVEAARRDLKSPRATQQTDGEGDADEGLPDDALAQLKRLMEQMEG